MKLFSPAGPKASFRLRPLPFRAQAEAMNLASDDARWPCRRARRRSRAVTMATYFDVTSARHDSQERSFIEPRYIAGCHRLAGVTPGRPLILPRCSRKKSRRAWLTRRSCILCFRCAYLFRQNDMTYSRPALKTIAIFSLILPRCCRCTHY